MADLNDAKEQLMLYAKENQKLLNELRELRHSKNNIIHGINGYIELEDWDGLKKYFCEVLEEARNGSDASLSSIEKILNPSLKTLISSVFKNARCAGIDIKVMVDDSIFIESNYINETDLCTVIGEFMNNAVEAASQAVNKKISIYVFNSEKSANIIIESTFNEKPCKFLKKSAEYPKVLSNMFIQHQVFVQEIQILR